MAVDAASTRQRFQEHGLLIGLIMIKYGVEKAVLIGLVGFLVI